MQHYSQWFTLSHHSHIWKRSAALRVPMRVSTEHLTRTPLSHVLAAQLYFVPNGHVIWWIGDPSWFESGLRLSGKQLRFLILLQHLVSEATCMSKQNRQRWSDSIFFVFWVCLQLRALALQPHWLWIGLLWCDPSRTTSQASGIRNMSVWYVWIFWNTLDVILRQLLVDSWTYCIIMLWNN